MTFVHFYIMTHFKATESTNNNIMKTLIHYPDLWNSNILINLHSFFLKNIIIETFCVSFLISFPFWLYSFTLVAEGGTGLFSEPNEHRLQKSMWSCSPKIITAGFVDCCHSLLEGQGGDCHRTLPESSTTLPNQLYSILHQLRMTLVSLGRVRVYG